MPKLQAFVAVGVLGLVLAGPGLPALAQDEDGLPAGPGREETLNWCSACHALPTITHQGMSRARWDETIDWMVEEQAMPAPPDDARKLIVDYLAKHFGESRGGKCVDTPWGRRCT